MTRSLTNRLTSILLLIAVWVTSLCVMASPSHACCHKANIKVQASMPACCVSHATVLPKAPPQSSDGHFGAWVSSNPLLGFTPLWALVPQGELLSLLAHRHVPDQSDLYMELGVWLN